MEKTVVCCNCLFVRVKAADAVRSVEGYEFCSLPCRDEFARGETAMTPRRNQWTGVSLKSP